jgi:Family of unknown function (DUF6236)
MSAHLGLYYPFIHFRDEAWLKLTCLYWDRMGRIVPAEYGLRDSRTVREFKDGNYVVDYQPGGDAQAETARVFQKVVAVYGERLVNRYGLHLASEWPDEPSTVYSRAARFGNAKLAYIFSPKLSAGLIEDLVALGLAEQGGRRDPRWIGMHPRLGAVYMTALAHRMATRRSAVPVSDDLLSHLAIGQATMDGMVEALLGDDEAVSASSRQAQILMADLAIRTVAPSNLENIPARKLIAFRQRYAKERAAFQDQVHSMVATLATQNIAEPEALEDHLRVEYDKLLQPHIDDLGQRLRGAGIDTTTAIFNIKTNPTGTTGAVALAFLSAQKPLIGAGAVALSVWGVGREYQRTRRSILAENRAAAYLYQVHTDLSPEGLAGKIARLGQRFWG